MDNWAANRLQELIREHRRLKVHSQMKSEFIDWMREQIEKTGLQNDHPALRVVVEATPPCDNS